MNILGDTLQLIASEKAGIIKPAIPVIIGEYQPEIADTFTLKAQQEKSDLLFASEVLHITKAETVNDFLEISITSKIPISSHQSQIINLRLDLTGTYQLKNIKLVLCAVDELRSQGFNITDEHLKTALRQIKTLTGFHGRWEILNKSPLTICDTGHNPEGIYEVLQNIGNVKYDLLHFILGVVNDKDISKILEMLPKNAVFLFCKPDIPRGLEAESLKQQAERFSLKGTVYPSVKTAFNAAQHNAGDNDLVFVGGSTFVVAEIV